MTEQKANELRVRVISQTRELYDSIAVSLSVPTSTGTITILPNHMDMVSLLSMGVITIKLKNSEHKILVNSGVVQVKSNLVTVLSDEAFSSQEVILKEINEAIENAKQQISSPISGPELIQLEKQLKFELFKKQFVEDH